MSEVLFSAMPRVDHRLPAASGGTPAPAAPSFQTPGDDACMRSLVELGMKLAKRDALERWYAGRSGR